MITTATHTSPDRCWTYSTILLVFLWWVVQGCGAVAPPISPDDIGIEVKLQEEERRKQKQDQKDSTTQDQTIVPIGEEEIVLPSLYPTDTR